MVLNLNQKLMVFVGVAVVLTLTVFGVIGAIREADLERQQVYSDAQQMVEVKAREIEQFFHTYKNLEDKSVEIDGWAGVAETLEILRFDHQRWLDEQPEIVDPDELHVLAPTDTPTVTLVTCYPFYHVGNAPQRFIVKAKPLSNQVDLQRRRS